MRLLVDLGGTNCRCALAQDDGNIVSQQNYSNSDFSSLENVLENFTDTLQDKPQKVAICVAGAVANGAVTLTNLDWHFSESQLQQKLHVDHLKIVNDFTAIAMSLTSLKGDDYVAIQQGVEHSNATIAVLGPGTGIGVSGLVPRGNTWVSLAGEGGHVTLAAKTQKEFSIIELIAKEFGHVSAERLICGSGLVNLYKALAEINGVTVGADVTPQLITQLALDDNDALACETLEYFYVFLANVAGNLALTLGAKGGVFLAGGILPRLKNHFLDFDFSRHFADKGRFSQYLSDIPIKLILDDVPAFKGLNALLDGKVVSA